MPAEKSSRRSRGSRVSVDPGWHAYACALAGRPQKSVEKIAAEMSQATGEPWSGSDVHRFAKDAIVSDRFLEAFCETYDTAYPIMAAKHPEEVQWLMCGRSMRDEDYDEFSAMLEDLQEYAGKLAIRAKIRSKRNRLN